MLVYFPQLCSQPHRNILDASHTGINPQRQPSSGGCSDVCIVCLDAFNGINRQKRYSQWLSSGDNHLKMLEKQRVIDKVYNFFSFHASRWFNSQYPSIWTLKLIYFSQMFPLSLFEKPDPVRFRSDRDCALGECTLLHECSGVWSLKCGRNLEPFPSQIYRSYVEFSICGILCWDPNVVTWLSWIVVLDYSGLFKKPERNWAVWFTLIYHVQ